MNTSVVVAVSGAITESDFTSVLEADCACVDESESVLLGGCDGVF